MNDNEARRKGLDEKFCCDCGKIIKIKAEICPGCGVRQLPITHAFNTNKPSNRVDTLWLPVITLLLGVLSFLTLFDLSAWDLETFIGVMFLITATNCMGLASLLMQKNGKAMAISGLVLSGIAWIWTFIDSIEYLF